MTPANPHLPRSQGDVVMQAADRLCQSLAEEAAGRERKWAEAVAAALTEVEKGLKQYQAATEMPDGGPLAEVDQTRPTLRRQSAEWRHDLARLREQCLALQKEVRRAVAAFQPTADTLLEWTGSDSIPVFGDFRRKAEELVVGLRQSEKDQASLVLESVTTDLGAGD